MFWVLFKIFPFIAWLFVRWFVVRPLHLKRKVAITWSLILLVCSQKFPLYYLLGGNAFNPELPELYLNVTGFLYSAFMIFFAFTVVLCLVRRVRVRFCVGALVMALAFAAWGMWECIRLPDGKILEVEIAGLPSSFDGFRLVQLSDIHCSAAMRRAHTEKIVARVNSLHPDVICITGDLADGRVMDRCEDVAPLAHLTARNGVLACTGNHEYYHNWCDWQKEYEALGITFLDSTCFNISRGNDVLSIGGVPDETVRAGLYAHHFPPPDVQKTFLHAPFQACRILLKHRPIHLEEAQAQNVSLQLSGHTHGGACRGLDILVANIENEGHVRGFYQEGNLLLYVSPGTGQWAGFPLRLGVPPEITLMILHPKK